MSPLCQAGESELGPELSRYRRRPEKEILREYGLSISFYCQGPIFAAGLSLFLTMPVFFLAKHMGAAPPMLRDPTWGPILAVWYLACFLAVLAYMYLLPRRVFLAIHQDGFVLQGRLRRYSIRFRDIAECHLISSKAPFEKLLNAETLEEVDPTSATIISTSSIFRLVVVDGTEVSWKGFLLLFPVDAVCDFVNQLQSRKSGMLRMSHRDFVLKRRLRLAGLLTGLGVGVTSVCALACDEKCRKVICKAFGPVFCGLPSEVSVPIMVAILFAPLVFVFPHFIIVLCRKPDWYEKREIRKAWQIVIAGGMYFLALFAAWGIYASLRGV